MILLMNNEDNSAERRTESALVSREVNGFHVLDVSADGPRFGLEDLERAEAQTDAEYRSQFAKHSA